MEERRRYPRIEVMLTGTNNGATCQLKDISTVGAQFLTTRPLSVGSPAELTIHIPLEVRWCQKIDEDLYAIGGEKGIPKWMPRVHGDDRAKSSPESIPGTRE